MIIEQISFDEILPIWRDSLWKGRLTKIRPTNGLKLMGGYDHRIEAYHPTFFGAYIEGKFVGVNSGHATSRTEYRSRGIYVFPNYRGRGVSQALLKAVEDQAKDEDKTTLWSMPRASAYRTYEKFGFKKMSEFFDDMEFGPNYYAVKLLEADNG